MPRRTTLQRSEVGLAPPREPIPGAITYEQVGMYGGSWWWNPLTVAGRIAVVGACVRLIAHQIGSLPSDVTRDGTPVPDPPGWLRNPAPSVYSWFGGAVEAITVSLLMRGNAYVIATEQGWNGYPLGWIVANPDQVSVSVDKGRITYRWGENVLTDSEVAHVKWLEVPGSPYGASPLESAWSNVRSASAMSVYAADLAGTGAMPFGLLSTEQRLAKGQAENLRNQFLDGGANRRGLLVLDSGLSYDQLQLSPKDMALLELQEFDARAICSVFGVPPSLVNVPMADGLTYSTVEGQQQSLLSFCLDPVLTRIEQVLSYRFLPGDRLLRFNRDRFTLPTFAERVAAYSAGISAGIFSAEEVRAQLGLPPGAPAAPAPVEAPVEAPEEVAA